MNTTHWLLERWRVMLLIRRSEEIIAQLVESGEAGCPCHLSIGQEAVAAGVCASLRTTDTIWGGHRSHGHFLAKGGSPEELLAEVLGRAGGCSGGRGGSMHLMDARIGIPGTVPIVAATVPLAVGAAFAAKTKWARTRARRVALGAGEAAANSRAPASAGAGVAVAFFGDGALEEGHVHESMNLAALYRLPVIFVCENNLYSSHLHWSERRVADNLARAGEFHSVAGRRVDGNDVEAVNGAARAAVERARRGGGPSLIECRTFRWKGHVGAGADLDVGVRRRVALDEWIAKDPLARARGKLQAAGVEGLEGMETEIEAQLREALERARRSPALDGSRWRSGVFAASSDAHGAPEAMDLRGEAAAQREASDRQALAEATCAS